MFIEEYMEYLKEEKHMAPNSLEAYKRDVMDFSRFISAKGEKDIDGCTNTDVVAYVLSLKEADKSPSTINRKLASLRSYYRYLQEQGTITQNPTGGIKAPKVEHKEIDFLSLEEVVRLLETPDDTVKGKRDRAILELMYATGIRVNEIIAANLEDVNLRIGFFACAGESGKARIVPIGRPAKEALEEYINKARDAFLQAGGVKQEDALFLNHRGGRMTRQGLWKILKEYGRKAEIADERVTPHILRNSFAVHMVQNGADLKSLQELLGNEGLTATEAYLAVTKSRIKDVYDKAHPRA